MRRPTPLAALIVTASIATNAVAAPAPATPTPPQSPAPAPPPTDKKEEARNHFELGLSHFDREEWSAALAEFLQSRALYPTRNATKNAALCLRKEGRFDEALDMWEALLRDFASSLTPTDRALAEKEVAELRASIGAVDVRDAEPGATIVVDGRERGAFPTPPIRVAAGSHVVRVSKEGFLPYEGRVEVAGRQTAVVAAKLGALTQSGRLRVVEQTGRKLDVVVDGAVVGQTPQWEGTLPVGAHAVVLRGQDPDGTHVGTQPAEAPVRLNQLTPLTLAAERLEASARVEPTPPGAVVAVDGVTVGRGVWEGELRAGGHRVEVAADGFLPLTRTLSLGKGERAVVSAVLERDPASPMWAAKHPARFFAEVDGALVLAQTLGGDVASACTGACDASVPFGEYGAFHGGYQLGTGLGFAIDAGYARLASTLTNRSATLQPVGRPANAGTVEDQLSLQGLLLGASGSFHRGESWPILLRLGVGVMLGSAKDVRTGGFTNSLGQLYPASATESPSATYLYFAPEARVGRRFGDHFELSAGATVLVLTALSQPKWQDQHLIAASPNPGTIQGDGLAAFGSQALTGSAIVAVLPGIGARYEF
jgi:hypothetical protein